MTTATSKPKPFTEIVDGKLLYNFHAGQWDVMAATERFILALGGSQSGKTEIGPPWLLREMTRRGPGDYLVVTPTYPLLSKKALPAFLRLFSTTLRLGKYNYSEKIFTFSDEGQKRLHGEPSDIPTKVFFCHAGDSDSLESATAKAAWLDEAGQKIFRVESWEAVQARLAINQGRCLITTTPYCPNWLKLKLFDPWDAARRSGNPHPLIRVVQFDSLANPSFPRAEFENALATMPRWRFDMRYRGKFARPAGMIYDCFDPEKHTLPRFRIPHEWPRHVGMDFGPLNTVAVFWAEELNDTREPTGKFIAYRVYKPNLKLDPIKHVENILAGETQHLNIVGGAWNEKEWRAKFCEAGLPVGEPPIKEREVGIDTLYAAISRDEVLVMNDLDYLLDELGSYSREVDDQGNPTEEIDDRAKYHCFVAGTQVATPSGSTPIERLRIGDRVLTRFGVAPVVLRFVRPAHNLREVTFSNGQTLIGTGNHPVWVAEKGFLPIDALRYGNMVYPLEQLQREGFQCERKWGNDGRQSGYSESPGIVIPMPQWSPIDATSSIKARSSIGWYGKFITARSQKATTFTTKTRTQATTISRTLRLSTGQTISANIGSGSVRLPCELISTAFATLRRNGIRVRRGILGMSNTANGPPQMLNHRSLLASIAASSTPPKLNTKRYTTARTIAGLTHAKQAESITSQEPVFVAGDHLPSTGTRRASSVAVRVVAVRNAKDSCVYNLTVARWHEYFANGILVSNCLDATRYLYSSLKQGYIHGWTPSESRDKSVFTAPDDGVFLQ